MSASYLPSNFCSIIGESAVSGSSATHSSNDSHHTFARTAYSEYSQASQSSYNSSNGSGGGSNASAETNMTGLGDITISFPDQVVPPLAIPLLQREDNNSFEVNAVNIALGHSVNEESSSPLKNFAPSINILPVNNINYSQLNDVSPFLDFDFNNLTSSVKKGVSPLWSSTAAPASSSSKSDTYQATAIHEHVNFVPSADAGEDDGQLEDHDGGREYMMTAEEGGGLQSFFDDIAFNTANEFFSSSDSIISGDYLLPAPAIVDMPIPPAEIVDVPSIVKVGHEIWTLPPSLEDGGLKKIAGRFAILGAHGCYLTVRQMINHPIFGSPVTTYPVFCDKTNYETANERWIMFRVFRGKKWRVGFQNALSRGFLGLVDARACLYADFKNDIRELRPWELFEVIPQPDEGKVAFRSMKNDRFLCVVEPGKGKHKKNNHVNGGEAICNRKEVKEWEQFTLYHII